MNKRYAYILEGQCILKSWYDLSEAKKYFNSLAVPKCHTLLLADRVTGRILAKKSNAKTS